MNFEAAVILRLIDRLTGPAKKAAGVFSRAFDEAAKKSGVSLRQAFSPVELTRAISAAEERLSKAQGRLLGAFGTAAAAFFPLRDLGNFEENLLAYAQTAGLSAEKVKAIGDQVRRVSALSNQMKEDVLAGRTFLVGKGMDETIASNVLPAIARASTATKAAMLDMSAAGYSVMDNLKVAAKDMALAFDVMNMAGKAGGFEIKNMAQDFPALTAAAQSLGMKGVPAVARLSAALQVALKGAGSPQEAANNMQNFLAKITSPEVVKNFSKKFGVNVKKEMEAALAKGLDPFERMLEIIAEKTGGDQFKLGEIFGDMQVQNFLKPMLANMEEYKRIRDVALGGGGSIDKDFELAMTGLNQKTKAVAIAFNNMLAAGETLLPVLKDIMDTVAGILDKVSAWTAANPELAGALVKVTAALMFFSVASALVKFALAGVVLNVYRLVKLFGGLYMAMKKLKGLGGLARILSGGAAAAAATTATSAATSAAAAAAAGAAGTGAAGAASKGGFLRGVMKRSGWLIAALLAYDGLSSISQGERPPEHLSPAEKNKWLDEKYPWTKSERIEDFAPVPEDNKKKFAGFGRAMETVLNSVSLFGAGGSIMRSLWDGLNSVWGPLLADLQAKAAMIKSTLGSGLVSGSAGAGSGGGGGGGWGGETPTPRGRGGAFRGGQLLQVGEKGPELARFGQSGSIVSNAQAFGRKGGGGNTFNANFYGPVYQGEGEKIVAEMKRYFNSALHDGVA